MRDLGSTGRPPPAGPPHHRHHFIAGVVTSDPDNPLGAVLGDLMVPLGSARLDGTGVPVVVGGSNHFALVSHPDVIGYVLGVLSSANT